ncbi:sensor histidine kinase [Desulfovibrio gilichinskyi]|uniref:histidine kinase n=1 Tax=Desulfovibrio gilichinskyi TaxID=1519643 RepID=A0A1X7CUZ3_9BACT|nr:PAS domain-containing sensor histidine kinase [Desulfovibrio gilichinskyi]SMF03150.1 PAS domain S-box-containing protein [Desulfovibrio gilichinskyi]
MSKASLTKIFQKKLIIWILVPGLLTSMLIVYIIGINQIKVMEREIMQLSKSLSQNVNFYIDGAEDVLQSAAIISDNEDISKKRSFFEGIHKKFSRFERLILLDRNENIIAVAPKGIEGVDFPIRFNNIEHDKHVLTSPIISPNSGKLVVYISLPVDNGGKIVAELSLDALQKFIYGFFSTNRIIILTDSYGNLIVHPDREKVRTQSNVGSLNIFKNVDNSGKGQFYKTDGEFYYGTVSHIPRTGWKILVACPAAYILEPVMVLGLLVSILIICFFLVLMIALRNEFKTRIISPMTDYINKLSDVAKGQYPTDSSQESEFLELNELGEVFDAMSEKVKAREQELQISKTFFQNIIDSMPSAVIWVDENMMACEYNKKALEIFGEGATEIACKKVEIFFSGHEEIYNAINESLKNKKSHTLEGRRVSIKSPNLYTITIFPLLGSEMKGVVVRMDDVTSRVRMEEIMVQTEKMMSVGGLAAGMAHEINNPLGSIMQGAQNLERRFSTKIQANVKAANEAGCTLESLQKYLTVRKINGIITGIRDSGARAAGIVSNMLEFSKPGKEQLTTVNIKNLIEASLKLAAKDYDLKKKYDFLHIKIVKDFDNNIPDVMCSRTEIEQVLFNLLKNAAQAMTIHGFSGTGPCITIRTRTHGSDIAIEVEDNGPGIHPEIRKRVFDPFFTTKTSEAGTGLGLSVSYFIITQNHGGTFTVESTPGNGAKFTIILPIQGIKKQS